MFCENYINLSDLLNQDYVGTVGVKQPFQKTLSHKFTSQLLTGPSHIAGGRRG